MNAPRGRAWAGVLLALLLTAGMAFVVPAAGLVPVSAEPGAQEGQDPQKPQKPPSEQPEGPIQRREKKPQQEEDEPFAIKVDVPIVNLDLTVVDRNGNFIPGLQPHHFRVYVDKKEVEVTAFAPSESPITAVILVEANPGLGYYLTYNNLEAVYLFLKQLKKGDWFALVGYDMRTRIEADFTQDQRKIMEALRRMQFPAGFRESNFYDALLDTLDRIKDVEGRKSIIIIATGVDTFSKHNWDETRRIVREHDATIFAIGMSWLLQLSYDRQEAFGRNMSIPRMTLQMAEAQLKDLARKSGGQAYFPRFQAALPGIYQEVGAVLRNQYSLAIRPGDIKRDGKFHKIKVELVGPGGEKLKVVDQNGKNVKYKVYHRDGFYAPAG